MARHSVHLQATISGMDRMVPKFLLSIENWIGERHLLNNEPKARPESQGPQSRKFKLLLLVPYTYIIHV